MLIPVSSSTPSPYRYSDDPTIREEVFHCLEQRFGFRIQGHVSGFPGLLNMKWLIETDRGPYFIKYYHPDRYNLGDASRRSRLERSLSYQHYLHEKSRICPQVYPKDGTFVQRTPSGAFFIVMEAVTGEWIGAGQWNSEQMAALGQATGTMHRLLAPCDAYAVEWVPDLGTMRDKWKLNYDQLLQGEKGTSARMLAAIEKQGALLATLDPSAFVESLAPHCAHWDLWADNLLYHPGTGRVSLLDFDSTTFAYTQVDVARALLSGAWHNDRLDLSRVAAFVAAYREAYELPVGGLPAAFRLLWCREAGWWLKGTYEEWSVPPKRFAEELIWLTEQWETLDELLGGI
ncbi:phosphotransferase enzyme family protein [Paenibacillus koleovorans]|uniref:phosphotransferase enzyme family protein n=1 Tax=Paenibacillus koleovorans TaxID=121608 RepID=UPI000FDCC8BA|nr:phosphotransferase [Paenibacillus koleovorans]